MYIYWILLGLAIATEITRYAVHEMGERVSEMAALF